MLPQGAIASAVCPGTVGGPKGCDTSLIADFPGVYSLKFRKPQGLLSQHYDRVSQPLVILLSLPHVTERLASVPDSYSSSLSRLCGLTYASPVMIRIPAIVNCSGRRQSVRAVTSLLLSKHPVKFNCKMEADFFGAHDRDRVEK